MDAAHYSLLLHTNVRWLSRGNETERVFESRDELKLFFEAQSNMDFFAWLIDEKWIVHLKYLVDILEQLNKSNLQMQGRNRNIIKLVDAFNVSMNKLENTQNVAMFEKLSSIRDVCGGDKVHPQFAKNEISEALYSTGK